MKKQKIKTDFKCAACGAQKWEKINEHVGFSGNNKITFQCQQCGRLQTEREIDLIERKE